MRNCFTLIFLLFFALCSAQNYLDSTSTWLYLGGAADFSGNLYTYRHVDYMDGDTTIGAYIYHKLYEDRYDSIDHGGVGGYVPYDTSKHNFSEFLRENNHQFFAYSTIADSDLLLVSFNYQLHDTVWLTDGCSESYTLVDSIDTAYLGSVPRRRFIYSDPNIFLLEGVGSYLGITTGCDGDIGIEGGIYLTCFGQDENTLSLSLTGTCNIPGFATSIRQIPAGLRTSVYPNPAHDELNMSAGCVQCAAELFSITGERIADGTTLFNGRGTLNLSGLSAGVYLLKIQNVQDGSFTNSLVVKQ